MTCTREEQTRTGEQRSTRWRLFSLKQSFFLFCALVIPCTLFAHFYLQRKPIYSQRTFPKCTHGSASHDTITPLPGNKSFIIAPYYDDREGKVIRTLGIVHTELKRLYCYLCCTVETGMHVSEAKIVIHEDRFGFPFGLADIICDEPPNCRPAYVYLNESPAENITRLTRFEIQNRDRGEFKTNFTVCISTLYGNYSNALQFIQTIEMYKLLGAQRVTIYLKNCSRQVEKILEHYSREGIIEVVPWPIHRYLQVSQKWFYEGDNKEIGYYGQMATLNDCLYKNMYRSRFVLLNDIDEIILPSGHKTWDNLMESLQKQNPGVGVFLFEAFAFPQTVVTDGNFSGISSWKQVPGFDILQHINREPPKPDIFNGRKMIVDPRKVVQTSVHSVLNSFGNSIKVPLETALVHHCRSPQQLNLNKSLYIDDRTIWKYNVSLIRNVNQVLNQLSLQ
ncbi:uncharacterized protein LOC134948102 [Pseudophryne corroboree]|uniref:uncharacterized protein LOC134948102 n=1 Tax=Pseudophryne corroboree TaxID=495146 RepID=UPI003081615E